MDHDAQTLETNNCYIYFLFADLTFSFTTISTCSDYFVIIRPWNYEVSHIIILSF